MSALNWLKIGLRDAKTPQGVVSQLIGLALGIVVPALMNQLADLPLSLLIPLGVAVALLTTAALIARQDRHRRAGATSSRTFLVKDHLYPGDTYTEMLPPGVSEQRTVTRSDQHGSVTKREERSGHQDATVRPDTVRLRADFPEPTASAGEEAPPQGSLGGLSGHIEATATPGTPLAGRTVEELEGLYEKGLTLRLQAPEPGGKPSPAHAKAVLHWAESIQATLEPWPDLKHSVAHKLGKDMWTRAVIEERRRRVREAADAIREQHGLAPREPDQ